MDPTGNLGQSAADTHPEATVTLQEFLTTTSELTTEERQRIVDQALILIEQAVETGAPFSDGLPVSPTEFRDCNDLGQQYHGPVVIIIDGLCYSTTDIFAAGWQKTTRLVPFWERRATRELVAQTSGRTICSATSYPAATLPSGLCPRELGCAFR
jgi:hypothetical protein